MRVAAKLRNASISPQKARLVADMIRKMPVERALELLQFSGKKGAFLIKKVLNSAIANAEHNHGADIDELRIAAIFVDEAAVLKRYKARAKGRGNRIIKRRCHITVEVSEMQALERA